MRFCALVAMLAAAAVGTAGEMIYSGDPQMGVNALPAERNRWRSKILRAAEDPTPADYAAIGELDFFRTELHRAESFDFDAGPTGVFSRVYGAKAFDNETSGVRVGRGWGALKENHARLEFAVEGQNVAETDWQVVFHARESNWNKRAFKLKNGANRVPLGVIGTHYVNVYGIEFICSTKGAKGRIASVRLVPEELPMGWRNRFTLAAKPAKAGISYDEKPNYTLTVNGRKVREGSRILFKKVRRLDITDCLRPGENTIEFTGNWGGGYDGGKTLTAEAFTVDAEGRTEYVDQRGWEARVGSGEWRKCRLGDDVGIDLMPNGRRIADGLLPLHAGPLTVAPKNPDGSVYPVFDYDGPITWSATVPKGLKDVSVSAAVGGRTYPVRNGTVDFAGLGTGAYEIEWTLRRGREVLDTDRTEMIVAGPLPGIDEVPYADFEATFAKRKRLLQEVDCTAEETNPTNFVDHTGPYGVPTTGVGRLVNEGGFRFRETGSGNGDFFGYKLKTGVRGKPHVLEVDVPDVREQILYIAVNEGYPVPFCNNGWPLGSRGWPNATGAARCGGALPLSGGKKTVTVVFFPGSDNATVCFENGIPGLRAGVIGWRLYEVPDGLPALRLPPTERLYANHNERIIFNNWGAHENPRAQEYGRDLFDGCWRAAYAGIANRISYLKFAGHNAALEGAYTYCEGFPTESGESNTCAAEWDGYYAMAKLYRHNRIRLLACFEYMLSPLLVRSGALDVSDDEVRAGTKRSVFCVDRHGRQVTGYMGSGLNYLNPKVRDSVNGLVREIYRRYSPTKAVEAIWTVNGYWWMPGIPMLQSQTAADIGYDDDSVEQFQADTGIDLKLPWTGAGRFPARYEALNGKYKSEWYGWRAKRLREALEDIRRIVTSEGEKWDVFAMPAGQYAEDHPFCRSDATVAERDGFLGDYLRRTGFDPDLYGKGTDARVNLVPNAKFERMRTLPNEGILANRGSRALYRKNDSLYFHPVGLNERPCQCPKAKAWWWQTNGIAVYDVKPVGENAFSDLADIVDEYAPKRLFHTWTDVNVTTAFTEEARRFLTGFYATPCGDPVRFGGIRGVTANRYGSAVQLVNDTPYPVRGTLTAAKPAEDALLCRGFTGTIPYELRPFGVTVVKTEDPERTLSGSFAFDAETSALVRMQAKTLVGNRLVAAKLTAAQREAFAAALEAGDDYAAAHQMRDWEVLSVAKRFFDSTPYLRNQTRLLEMLEKENCVRVDCGNLEDFTDEKGRLWLRDQPYTGFGAYGNEFGIHVDRGPIPIGNTDMPGIYRTEAGSAKSLYYHLPLPAGAYRVVLHFSETWDEVPGRAIKVTVGGVTKVVKPWDIGGGRCTAAIVEWPGVRPSGGILTVKLEEGSPIINGLEVYRESKGGAEESASRASASARKLVEWTAPGDKPLALRRDGHQWLPGLTAGYVPKTTETTLSVLVKATGTCGILMASFPGVRFDVGVDKGAVRPAIVGFPVGKTFFTLEQPEHKHLSDGWHHIVYMVNPAGEASVWVDGERLLACDFAAKFDGQSLPARTNGGLQLDFYNNARFTDDCTYLLRRATLSEGLMTLPEIQAEADAWLAE